MGRVFKAQPGDKMPQLEGSVCAIGVFDGVHVGHRHLIGLASKHASDIGAPAVVMTFDKDPDEIFRPASLKKLSSNASRISKLSAQPVDNVAVVDFTQELARMEPFAFLDSMFGANMPKAIYVGEDFRFGSRAKGGIDDLRKWGEDRGVDVASVPLLQIDGADIKSTRIRELLSKGNLEEANRLLGSAFSIEGRVQHGRGEGAGMGFATANLDVPESLMPIAEGVYAGYASFDGERRKAAISVGIPPMFKERSKDALEVHVLGFEGDLYGKDIKVEFVKRLRPMMEFESQDALISQVSSDIEWIEQNL